MESEKIKLEQQEIEDAVKELKKSMRFGLEGTNYEVIIQILLNFTNNQRQLIKTKYQDRYKQYLTEDFKSNLSGHFLETVLALVEDTYKYEAKFMNQAISKLAEDEQLICELLCSKDAREIKHLKHAYQRIYERDMESDILHNRDGDKNNLYFALASGQRQENHGYDLETVKNDAKSLIDACKNKLDEQVLVKILSTVSFPQLYATFACFAEMANESMESIAKKHLSGNILLTCLTMIKCIQNKPAYFAEKIHDAVGIFRNDDTTLIRLFVSRSEIDLNSICQEYKLIYKKSLRDLISSKTSGDYQKCLLAIIGKNL